MKKLLTIFLILFSLSGGAQTIQYLGSPTTQIYVRGQLRVDTFLYLPLRDTTVTPAQIGAFIVKGTVPYIWTGTKWTVLATGSPLWGSITGTLSSQTDLQNALNAKQDVVTGGFGIKKTGVTLAWDSAVVRKVDTMFRVNDSTLQYTINGSSHTVLIRGTPQGGINSLVLNSPATPFNDPTTFTNVSGAWSGSLVLSNQNANTVWSGPTTGSPAQPGFRALTTADLPTGIPNGNLANSTITYAGSNTGTDISITPATVSLGGTVTVAIPNAGPSARGALTAGDWNTFNNKPISVNGQTGVVITKSADSIKAYPVDTSTNRNNYLLTFDSTNHKWKLTAGASSGVSSVALTAPSILNVAGSPITTSGTIALTLANQTQNLVFASPNGSSGAPTFRAFLNADLPTSGVSAGTYNSLTVNAQGIVTAGSNVGAGITSLNGLTGATQTFATGTAGTDFNISSSSTTHTFNIPSVDGTHRGLVPASGGGTSNYLRADGTWATPAGTLTEQQTYDNGTTLNKTNTHTLAGFPQVYSGGKMKFDSMGVATAQVLTDSVPIFDNSIGTGTGAFPVNYRYSSVFTAKYRSNEDNYSVSGTTMQVDGLAKIPLIPSYANTKARAFIIGYLENDIINAGNNATWDTAHCGPIFRQFVDTIIARGTPASHIILRSPVPISTTTYANATLVRQAQYFAMEQSVATTLGCVFVDVYNPINYRGGVATMMYDQVLHPNNGTYSLIADLLYKGAGDSARSAGQGIENNRSTSLRNVSYHGNDTLSAQSQPLGVDSNGKVGVLTADQVILGTTGHNWPQPANVNLVGYGAFGNTVNTALPTSISLFTPGTIQGGSLRITSTPPAGWAGAGGNFSFNGTGLSIFNRNFTSNADGPVYLNQFGTANSQVLVGTTTLTGSGALFQVNGSAEAGSFRATSTWVGARTGVGTEIGSNGTLGYITALNSSGGVNLNIGFGLCPIISVGANTITGTLPFQVNSGAYINGLVGVGVSAPTAYMEINRTVSSPTTGAKGIDFAIGASTYTFAADQAQVVTASIDQKTHAFLSAHTTTDASSFDIIGAPLAGTNATITNRYAFRVKADKSQFNGTVQVKDGTQTANSIFTGDANGNGAWATAVPSGVTATTQSANDNSTKVATTAYVDAASAGVKLLYTAVGATQAVNTSSETSIAGTGPGSLTIAANALTVGKSYRFKISGIYNTTTIPGNVTFKIKIGSVTIGTGTVNNLITTASGLAWSCSGNIVCWTTGSSGSAITDAVMRYSQGNLLAADILELDNNGVVSTINTTISNAIDFTVQWITADPSNAWKATTFTLEALN